VPAGDKVTLSAAEDGVAWVDSPGDIRANTRGPVAPLGASAVREAATMASSSPGARRVPSLGAFAVKRAFTVDWTFTVRYDKTC